MDFNMLGAATIPVIVGICAITGWLIKRANNEKLNDFIPTIVCIEGVILAFVDCYMTGSAFDISTLFAGMASGVASTGFHQMITRWIANFDRPEGDHAA